MSVSEKTTIIIPHIISEKSLVDMVQNYTDNEGILHRPVVATNDFIELRKCIIQSTDLEQIQVHLNVTLDDPFITLPIKKLCDKIEAQIKSEASISNEEHLKNIRDILAEEFIIQTGQYYNEADRINSNLRYGIVHSILPLEYSHNKETGFPETKIVILGENNSLAHDIAYRTGASIIGLTAPEEDCKYPEMEMGNKDIMRGEMLNQYKGMGYTEQESIEKVDRIYANIPPEVKVEPNQPSSFPSP